MRCVITSPLDTARSVSFMRSLSNSSALIFFGSLMFLQVLLSMLAAYHSHVKTYENTLITKIFGLHRIKPYGGQKVNFLFDALLFVLI